MNAPNHHLQDDNQGLARRPRAVFAATASLALGALVAQSACHAPGGDSPGRLSQAQILDYSHGSTIPGFWFLEPFVDVDAPQVFHTFAAGANPTVTVDQVDVQGNVLRAGLATFTTLSGPRYGNGDGRKVNEHVRLHPAGGRCDGDDDDGDDDAQAYYYVRIDADDVNLVTGNYYRVRVTAPVLGVPRQLGFADILVVRDKQAARRVDDDKYVPLIHGHGVRVKFRIDTDALDPCLGVSCPVGASCNQGQCVFPPVCVSDTLESFGCNALLPQGTSVLGGLATVQRTIGASPLGIYQSGTEDCEFSFGPCSTLNVDAAGHSVLVAADNTYAVTFRFARAMKSFSIGKIYGLGLVQVTFRKAGLAVLTDSNDRNPATNANVDCQVGDSRSWTPPSDFDEVTLQGGIFGISELGACTR